MKICVPCVAALGLSLAVTAQASIRIRHFEPVANVCRAGRPEPVIAVVINDGEKTVVLRPSITLPEGVRVLPPVPPRELSIEAGGEAFLGWTVRASAETNGRLALDVISDGENVAHTTLRVQFLPPLAARPLTALPEPQPVKTPILIGAHHCPLWESDKPQMWESVFTRHPERMPALGYYSQENPEVADWETTWAVEHGISFFVYCWYRTSQGGPVTTRFSSAIHDALFKSRFVDRMKFAIMWENQHRGTSGVAGEKDLFENLFPFWMENYFKHPSYLKVDNKPVLFVYQPYFMSQDLGGHANTQKALERMRAECRRAGFDGMYILGEYRGLKPDVLKMFKAMGLDTSFAYCWGVPNHPTPDEAIAKQMEYIRATQDMNILPQVVTVSQAWSGWRDEGSIWKIPPRDFEKLLRQAKAFIETLPAESLGRRMLLLDNWNEWGEGHYIAPYREYGFGYLDAVRKVFAPEAGPHIDRLPEDIGKGPYDITMRSLLRREEGLRRIMSRLASKTDVISEKGLVGWWAFDEAPDDPIAFDYSGQRRGGRVVKATRGPGIDGPALVCAGGHVAIPAHASLSVTSALTITCWVHTDQPQPQNTWFVNRIQGGSEKSGYRMGLAHGKPCLGIPLTAWSHHLQADRALPANRWVHLAGTFDGRHLRLYMDGEPCGVMERPGPIAPNNVPLYLGSYAPDHPAHFKGLLDEVKLYDRVLTPEEIRAQAERGGATTKASAL